MGWWCIVRENGKIEFLQLDGEKRFVEEKKKRKKLSSFYPHGANILNKMIQSRINLI